MTMLLLIFTFFTSCFGELYPSSCLNLPDGPHTLKLLDGDAYPFVNQKCSNEYIILDYSRDNKIQHYFSSWHQWYTGFHGPSFDEIINWKNWISFYKNENSEFLISPDCNTCSNDKKQLYSTSTGYYLTGTIFGCNWHRGSLSDCDYYFDSTINSYACHSCVSELYPTVLDETSSIDDYSFAGKCPAYVNDVNLETSTDHADCIGRSLGMFHPSIGTDGQFCVCVKPTNKETVHFEHPKQPIRRLLDDESKNHMKTTSNTKEPRETPQEPKAPVSNKPKSIIITQDSFANGPLRITKPGTYLLMEDIEFNFNEGSIDDPQASDAWWPTSDDNELYPGAGGTNGPWFMGFFAGITIECDNVILDLNQFELKMNDIFYYQQRWFTNIELSTQYFIPGEGPISNFGGNPQYASNVVIKNGKLGLTSHHSIHGNNNNNIEISDLDISGFETHGIQMNGFQNLTIKNVEIHDSTQKAYFTPEYSHMKALLPLIRQVALENGDKLVRFKNEDEDTTLNEVLEDIEYKMNLVFNYVVNEEEPEIDIDCSLEDWEDAKRTYYNEDGYFYGAAQYGMFLNGYSASVISYRLHSRRHSSNAYIKNVKVYNLNHKMKEGLFLKLNGARQTNYFAAPYDAALFFADSDEEFNELYSNLDPNSDISLPFKGKSHIKGLLLTSNFLKSYEWKYLLGFTDTHEYFLDYSYHSENLRGTERDIQTLEVQCNIDPMIHEGKGTTGIRIDAVDDITFKHILVYDLHEYTELGSELCGKYGEETSSSYVSENTFKYTLPVQKGFSGNNLQGISIINSKYIVFNNIYINNLISDYGLTYGIATWPNNKNIIFKSNININNLYAGNELDIGIYEYDDNPNNAPDACAILFYDSYYSAQDGVYFTSDYQLDTSVKFNFYNILGHSGCRGASEIAKIPSNKDFITYTSVDMSYDTANDNIKDILDWESESDGSLDLDSTNLDPTNVDLIKFELSLTHNSTTNKKSKKSKKSKKKHKKNHLPSLNNPNSEIHSHIAIDNDLNSENKISKSNTAFHVRGLLIIFAVVLGGISFMLCLYFLTKRLYRYATSSTDVNYVNINNINIIEDDDLDVAGNTYETF